MVKKKTHDQFMQEVHGLVNDEYCILSEYVNNRTHVEVKHNKCGYEYLVKPSNFLNGTRCPKCFGAKKITHKEYVNLIYDLVRENYTVLGNYINAKTKIKMKHNTCGHEWEVLPTIFKGSNNKKGSRCPKCNNENMARKKRWTHERFIEEVYDRVGDQYSILGKYVNSQTNIEMKHNMCGYEYLVKPNNFIGGSRCPACNSNFTKTHEQFVKEIYDLFGNEFEALEVYVNLQTKVKIRHNSCGYEWKVIPYPKIFGCPICSGKIKRTTEMFKEAVFKLVGEEYTVLGEYINTDTRINMRHNTCGNEYLILPYSFLQGRQCKKCTDKALSELKVKSHDTFVKEVFELVGDEFEILNEYVNARTKIKMKHSTCGKVFNLTPNAFLTSTQRCPKCHSSKGERIIVEWMDRNNIEYKQQYKFVDCRHILTLPFDCAVFKNSKLLMLIEFDGMQHFRPIKLYGGEEGFELRKKLDNIKNEYCYKNDISLLRISYKEFNKIDDILEETLRPHFPIRSN
ncbi:hypothetical protein COJ00_26970 [Priestia megaterium]|uniref:hypothetical protein n=1 Tax=Priestia megaterium TaxID=1404 RepID=UPI000BF54A56|nr:hypothetical protein [Priestia megaterium]PFJ40176.1 hypothetical protein COJ00_26970 [Priestia megaterium]